MQKNEYLNHLESVALQDVRHLRMKERTYGDSWKKRGGVGAYMMLARKIDRIENMIRENRLGIDKWDVFGHISSNPTGEDGTMLAEIRDLRRYLLLVEAEMVAQGVVDKPDHLDPEQRKMVEQQLDQETHGYDSIEETSRVEPDPTYYEFEQFKDRVILCGSMKGRKYEELYRYANGRNRMLVEYRKEYSNK